MADLDINFNTHVVLDGLPPDVAPQKHDLFRGFLGKKASAEIGGEVVVKLVDDPATGFAWGAFVDCRTVEKADKALVKLNKFRPTKAMELLCNSWSEFESSQDVPDTYIPPKEEEGTLAEMDLTNPFMLDPLAKPQFLVKGGEQFHVNWFSVNPATSKLDPMREKDGKNPVLFEWSEMDRRAKKLQKGLPNPFPMWSPQGNYVISLHPTGLKLWGGKQMQLVTEIPVQNVEYVAMSNTERYMILYNKEISFRDVTRAKLIRTFPTDRADNWKYNADDTMVATVNPARGTVNIYNAETMRLLSQELPPKHTLHYEGLSMMSWSPTNPNLLAYVVQGTESEGWRVQIDKIHELGDDMVEVVQLSRRNYFQTTDLQFLWHPTGSLLAAKVTKTKGSVSYGIFRVTATAVSAEALDIVGEPLKFNWQPSGARFGVITHPSASRKQTITFYSTEKVGVKEIGSFPTECVAMYFSPVGTRCCAVNFDKSRIEFYGVPGSGPFTSDAKMQMLASVEHPMITRGEWDPTGRYFASMTSYLSQQMDNQWMLWNVNGQKIFEQKLPKLSHVSFRPLAQSHLTDADLKKIRAELPVKSKKYVEEALAEQKAANAKAAMTKETQEKKYREVMDAIAREYEAKGYAATRAKLRASAPSAKRQAELLAAAEDIAEEVEREVEE